MRASLRRLRKDFSIWLKIQGSEFSFLMWWECGKEMTKPVPTRHLGRGWAVALSEVAPQPHSGFSCLGMSDQEVFHIQFLCNLQSGNWQWETQRVLRFLRAWEEKPTLYFPRAQKYFYFIERLMVWTGPINIHEFLTTLPERALVFSAFIPLMSLSWFECEMPTLVPSVWTLSPQHDLGWRVVEPLEVKLEEVEALESRPWSFMASLHFCPLYFLTANQCDQLTPVPATTSSPQWRTVFPWTVSQNKPCLHPLKLSSDILSEQRLVISTVSLD